MDKQLSNLQVFGLIFLIFYSLFKSIAHIILSYNLFNLDKKQKDFYHDKIYSPLSDIANLIFILLSVYLLVKNIKGKIYLFICALLLFKGIFHFVSDYKLIKLLGFNKHTQDKIKEFHHKFALLSDLGIGGISLLILIKIFVF
jgi:hypothetical protein